MATLPYKAFKCAPNEHVDYDRYKLKGDRQDDFIIPRYFTLK